LIAILLISTIAINFVVAAIKTLSSFVRFVRRTLLIRKSNDRVVALKPILNDNVATTETVKEFIEKPNA